MEFSILSLNAFVSRINSRFQTRLLYPLSSDFYFSFCCIRLLHLIKAIFVDISVYIKSRLTEFFLTQTRINRNSLEKSQIKKVTPTYVLQWNNCENNRISPLFLSFPRRWVISFRILKIYLKVIEKHKKYIIGKQY